ncbi:MAG: hypothetical protein ACI4RT_03785 [Candidatus Spyradenecus sp.]
MRAKLSSKAIHGIRTRGYAGTINKMMSHGKPFYYAEIENGRPGVAGKQRNRLKFGTTRRALARDWLILTTVDLYGMEAYRAALADVPEVERPYIARHIETIIKRLTPRETHTCATCVHAYQTALQTKSMRCTIHDNARVQKGSLCLCWCAVRDTYERWGYSPCE